MLDHVSSSLPLLAEAGAAGAPPAPAAAGWPVIGSIPGFMRDPNRYFAQCYRQHGPVFRIRLGPRQYTVICGVEGNQWVTRNERDYFTAEGSWDGASRVMGGSPDANLANVDGKRHIKLRGIFRRTMGRTHSEARLGDTIRILNEELDGVPRGMPVDILSVLKRVVYRQLGTNTTGHAPPQLFEDCMTLIDAIIHVTRAPFLGRFPIPRKVRRANARIGAFTEELAARALDNPIREEHRTYVHDILQGLQLGLYNKGDLGMLLAAPFVAGLDTLANTLGFVLYRLGQHEDARRRVVAEVQAAYQGDDLDPATLASCHALQGAIKETMRLHPISPGQLRTVKAPVRLNGYQLMPGEHLIIAHAAAHFLENAYVDPERFDLDRHAPANRDEQVPGAYAPFGIGPHTCLGAGTANLLLAANVAALLHRYEISLYPSNYRLRVSNLELPKPVGLRVIVTPRSKFRAPPSSGGAAL